MVMCEFCEFNPKMDQWFPTLYGQNNGHFVMMRTEDGRYFIECEDLHGDYWDMEIKYCPVCGRKLGGENG